MVCHSRPCEALCVAGGGVLPIPATLGVQCASSGSCAAATGVAASTGSALSGFRLIAPEITHTVQASRSSRPIAPPASVLREGTACRRRAAHGGTPRRGLASPWPAVGGEGGPRPGNLWLRPRREATAGPARRQHRRVAECRPAYPAPRHAPARGRGWAFRPRTALSGLRASLASSVRVLGRRCDNWSLTKE